MPRLWEQLVNRAPELASRRRSLVRSSLLEASLIEQVSEPHALWTRESRDATLALQFNGNGERERERERARIGDSNHSTFSNQQSRTKLQSHLDTEIPNKHSQLQIKTRSRAADTYAPPYFRTQLNIILFRERKKERRQGCCAYFRFSTASQESTQDVCEDFLQQMLQKTKRTDNAHFSFSIYEVLLRFNANFIYNAWARSTRLFWVSYFPKMPTIFFIPPPYIVFLNKWWHHGLELVGRNRDCTWPL